jgi:hypothetical protein
MADSYVGAGGPKEAVTLPNLRNGDGVDVLMGIR